MRLFIAIKLNDETRKYIMHIVNKLEGCSKKGKFVPEEKLHITILFLGETEVHKIEKITSAIEKINEKAFVLNLHNIGKFNMGRKGLLYWLGVEKRSSLFKIHEQIYNELKAHGFILQNRKFKPHVTLGRNVEICDEKAFNLLKEYSNKKKFKFLADSICLYSSERINGNMQYAEIYNKKL